MAAEGERPTIREISPALSGLVRQMLIREARASLELDRDQAHEGGTEEGSSDDRRRQRLGGEWVREP